MGLPALPFKVKIPDEMMPFLKPARFKSAEGGRGSAKSHTIARLLVMRAFSRETRILCAREIQKSIRASVYQLVMDVIKEYGLGWFFDTANGEIIGQNGSKFMFSGLREHTIDSIKSLEGIDIVWLEEAQRVSKRSWVVLTPTIRKAGSEIWASWNPDLEEDEIYQRIYVRPWLPAKDMILVKINYEDNPWFPEVLDAERIQLKAINEDLYNHVWMGHLRSAAGLMFKRKWFENTRFHLDTELPKHLMNYGFSDYASTDVEDMEEEGADGEPDWTEIGVAGMDEHKHLWFRDWYSGQVDPDVWSVELVQFMKQYKLARYFEESGVIYRSTKGAINLKMRKANTFTQRVPLPSTGSKADRAQGFQMLCAMGMVHIPYGEWGDKLIDQLCSFTGLDGRVDDMVDACSKLAQGLDSTSAAVLPQEKKRRIIRPLSVEHLEYAEEALDSDEKRRYHEV